MSLLLSLAALVAWVMSYARPLGWHLLAIAHSADLAPVSSSQHPLFMKSVNTSSVARYGYCDAFWARSASGRLTLVAHAIDYEGNLGSVYASPPSLIVELSGAASTRAVAFGGTPESRGWGRHLGFAWHGDAQQVVGQRDASGEPVSVRARMVTLPYWAIVGVGLSPLLLWLRSERRRVRSGDARPRLW